MCISRSAAEIESLTTLLTVRQLCWPLRRWTKPPSLYFWYCLVVLDDGGVIISTCFSNFWSLLRCMNDTFSFWDSSRSPRDRPRPSPAWWGCRRARSSLVSLWLSACDVSQVHECEFCENNEILVQWQLEKRKAPVSAKEVFTSECKERRNKTRNGGKKLNRLVKQTKL